MPLREVSAVSNHSSMDDYSEQQWPEFSVPDMFCLPRGEKIVVGQGRWWKSRGGLEQPVHVVADLIPKDKGQRDNVTMHRFLEGLGLQPSSIKLEHGPFEQCVSGDCAVNTSRLLESAQKHLRENPPSQDYAKKLQAVFAAMGRGVVGDWTGIGCKPSLLGDGLPLPEGACQAASLFAERFLMELGGGMELAWGRLKKEQVPELLELHTWHFFNWFAPVEIYRLFGASMAQTVLRRLDEAEGGTRLFVGHDTDIMMLKAALGLTWDPTPFPINATLPGSMLKFVREGDRVTASFFHVKDFGDDSGEMAEVNAVFMPGDSTSTSFDRFAGLLRNGSYAACACPDSSAAQDHELGGELVV